MIWAVRNAKEITMANVKTMLSVWYLFTLRASCRTRNNNRNQSLTARLFLINCM
jgi:hypothetical protein